MGFLADQGAGQGRTRIVRLLPALGVIVAVALIAGGTVVRDFRQERAQAAARLESVAELRATQVQAWLDRHLGFAQFLDDSAPLAGLYTRWQDHGDAAAGAELMALAIDSRHGDGADSALVVDAQGNALAREYPSTGATPPELRRTVRQAVAAGNSTASTIYLDAGSAIPLRLDIVIPLLKTGRPAHGALVLRMDPRRSLLPTLADWPVPSRTAEAVLWDRSGGRIANISELHGRADSLGRISEPIAASTLPIARVVRGELAQGVALRVNDEWGVPVMWVAHPVAGTDWWLVAKMDMAEVDAPAWQRARVTAVAALLALFVAGLSGRLWSQRRLVRQVEQERHEHRERLRTLALLEAIAQSASDAIYATDTRGRFVFCNPAAARLLGRPVDAILGRSVADVLGPEVALRMAEDDRRALAGELEGAYEEEISTPEGTLRMLTNKGPLVDGEGKVLGLLGVSRNVSEMREARRALRAREEHYRQVVSVLEEGIVVWDPQGRIVSSNPAAAWLLGGVLPDGEPHDRVATEWESLRPDGTTMPSCERPTTRVLAGEGPQHDVLMHVVNPAGERLAFMVSAVPLTDADNRLTGVVSTFVNVTVKHRMEADLRRHRDELEAQVAERTRELRHANEALEETVRFGREITDAIPGLVSYWDSELRCRYANRSYLESFGRTAEQVIGHTRGEIFGAGHEDSGEDLLALALRGEPQVFERKPGIQPGDYRVHQVHYVPAYDALGAIRGVYMMAFDISALKHAEAELTHINAALARSRDEAETANRAKSAFVANISHEIRTPLNAILGLAYLLARDPRDAMQRDRLAKIGDAGQHLLQIINDVLDISKIEAGKLTLEEADFALDALLAKACGMVGGRAHDKGLELVLDTDRLPQRLRGDPTRLSQMILNLLSNAVKFTDTGWVRLRGDLLDDRDGRVQVRFEVQDTGPGIAVERQAELFDAFQQGDSTMTRRFGGTGLGLSLTRNLAAAMGGAVGVRSVPGAGSTFWFTAWLAHAARADEAASLAPLKAMRVLLVDELPAEASAIADVLAGMGMQADAHTSGEAAVQRMEAEMAQGRPYDLLLVDAGARCDDGTPALLRLHAQLGEGMPPCVVLRAPADGALAELSHGVKVDAALRKPVTASALQDLVARLLYRRGGARAAAAIVRDASQELVRERHAGCTVLLAEDNIINRLIARELLSNAGLVVQEAENGAIALALAESRSCDLILMDMQMPVMDGLVAARAIRAGGDLRVPIVAMTANAFAADRAACLAAGMSDHIAKPVDPQALYEILLRWLPLRVARA